MKLLSRKTERNLYRIIFVLLGVLAIMWFFIFRHQASEKTIQQNANQLLSQLYIDDEHEMININLTKEEFDTIQEQLKDHAPSQNALKDATQKFEMASLLETIYHKESIAEQPHFTVNVSADAINEAENYLAKVGKVDDAFYDQCYTLMDEAKADYETIETFQGMMQTASVPQCEVRQDIPAAVEFVAAQDDKYQAIKEHGVTIDAIKEHEQYLDELSDLIVEEYGVEYYSDTFIDEMYAIPSLAERFKLTPMDRGNLVALTFDDGPNKEYTTQILDILDKNNVIGTFFVMGAYVDENPEVAKEIVDRGHIIANHTYNHFNLADLPDDEVLKQFRWTQESIVDATGFTPDLYRLPFGSGGRRVVKLVDDMTSILWTTDSLDWSLQDADKITEHVMNNLTQHMNLLMHDTSQYSVDALDNLIPLLKEEGYHFVKPDQLDFYMRYYAE